MILIIIAILVTAGIALGILGISLCAMAGEDVPVLDAREVEQPEDRRVA